MQHKVGNREDGFLWTGSSNGTFEAIFEDDGETGYFYGLDNRRKESGENAIVHALHIYNVASVVDPHADYTIEIRWADTGNRVGLFIESGCHAVVDFDQNQGVSRTSDDWDEGLAEGL